MRKYAAAVACAAAVLFVALQLFFAAKSQLLFGDFRAFYCAGSAVLHGSDPYAGPGLYACESTSMPFGLYRATRDIALPAPFPGYALAFFAAFAALPYVAACGLWLAALLASTAGSCVALARLTGQGIASAIAVAIVPLAVIVLPYGELTSIELCALLWLALAIRARRWTLAGVAAGFAMILPHVGIPALLGVFAWETRMRLRLAALALLLTLFDILAGGAHAAIAYVASVLPAHTLSELGGVNQYGLTWALYALGANAKFAVRAGEISFVGMTIAGVLASGPLAKRSSDGAYAVLVPPAFAVFGGSFMHYTEIIVALGAATLLAARTASRGRALFAGALLLLATPWLSILSQPALVVVFAITCAAIAVLVCEYEMQTALRIAACSVAVAATIFVVANHYGPAVHASGVSAFNQSLAQASWAKFVGTMRSSAGIVWWIAKAPTWLGLALLTTACAYATRGSTTRQPEATTASIG